MTSTQLSGSCILAMGPAGKKRGVHAGISSAVPWTVLAHGGRLHMHHLTTHTAGTSCQCWCNAEGLEQSEEDGASWVTS